MCAYYPKSKVEIHGIEARYYDTIMDIVTFGIYSRIMRNGIAAMNISKSDRILDLGAGTGKNACIMSKYLSENGEIIGLDISDEMISQFEQRCAKLFNVKIVNRRIDKELDFDGIFNKVFISFVLHGFPQDVRIKIIQNARKSLKIGGKFFILDYAQFLLDEMPFYLKIPFKAAECPYAFEFIELDWAEILRSQGFVVVNKYPLFSKYVILLEAEKI